MFRPLLVITRPSLEIKSVNAERMLGSQLCLQIAETYLAIELLKTDATSEVCHPRCVFKLYGEVNSVKKNTSINIWLNDGVY